MLIEFIKAHWAELLVLLVALLLIYRAGYKSGSKGSELLGFVEKFKGMTDNDQLLMLTATGIIMATATSLFLMLFVIITKSFEGVVIGMVSGYITLVNGAAWTGGFLYWFQSSHGSRLKDKATLDAPVEVDVKAEQQ